MSLYIPIQMWETSLTLSICAHFQTMVIHRKWEYVTELFIFHFTSHLERSATLQLWKAPCSTAHLAKI